MIHITGHFKSRATVRDKFRRTGLLHVTRNLIRLHDTFSLLHKRCCLDTFRTRGNHRSTAVLRQIHSSSINVYGSYVTSNIGILPEFQRRRIDSTIILVKPTRNLKILAGRSDNAIILSQITRDLRGFKRRSITVNSNIAGDRVHDRDLAASLLNICANRGSLNTAAFDGQGLNIVCVPLGDNGF